MTVIQWQGYTFKIILAGKSIILLETLGEVRM
jgi:hypothetical protein